MKPVHPTAGRIYDVIERYQAENGFNPSIREIMAITGVKSTSNVSYHLRGLERAGWLGRSQGFSRCRPLLRRPRVFYVKG